MRDFTVRDGDRALMFLGIELADQSTLDARGGRPREYDDLRWTELTVYRTTSGQYVLEIVGRSDVYHRAVDETPKSACGYGTRGLVRDLDSEHRPCPRCEPLAVKALKPHQVVFVEVDRYNVVRSENAEQLVASCYSSDQSGYRYLASVYRRVLAEAASKDEAIASAYTSERIS